MTGEGGDEGEQGLNWTKVGLKGRTACWNRLPLALFELD